MPINTTSSLQATRPNQRRGLVWGAVLCVSCPLFVTVESRDDEKPTSVQPSLKDSDAKKRASDPDVKVEKRGVLIRLTPDYELWIDPVRKRVLVDGQVCLREGNLEMFACIKGTKEHESIVSVNCKAKFIHAALLAVGAKSGKPVEFDPKYSPPSGSVIDVFVNWADANGKKHEIRAQDWIKYEKTGKAMTYEFVFAGSGFGNDPTSGEEYYFADAGDLICVSNFPSAMLDIPIASSQLNDALLFSAFTERIPARGTKLQLVFVPRLEARKGKTAKNDPKDGKDQKEKQN